MGSKGALHSTFGDAQREGWHKSEKQEAAKIPVTQLQVHLTAGAALLPSTLRDLEVKASGSCQKGVDRKRKSAQHSAQLL